jgi:hypothetical protein
VTVHTLAALAVLAAVAGPAAGASLSLRPQERDEAIRVGQRSVTTDDFDAEWRVTNDAGHTAVVMTPFHRLVVAARHAAFRKEALKPREPEKVLKEQANRLVVWVHLKGPRPDFARFYTPRLLTGDREIEPAFVQNERTALPQPDGRFLARCVYAFPTKALTESGRVSLVVADGAGRDVSRFTIDLSRMR